MLDLKWIRENPSVLDQGLMRRGQELKADFILSLDKKHREYQTEIQELQNNRNILAKQIGAGKQKNENVDDLVKQAALIKEKLPTLEEELEKIDAELQEILERIPNLLEEEVPTGKDESANKVISEWGKPKSFSFTPLRHYEIGTKLNLMDFEGASRMSGARFVVLKGALALLERALANFMLDVHTLEFGYQEVSPPLLVLDKALFGTGQLPKFKDDFFHTTAGLWLIPTAEVSLTNLVREDILEEENLPLRFVAHTPCFRSEAGAAGKDTRGMIRQHQFYKVELVSIAHPDESAKEHQRMLECAQTILKKLELPYRTVILCSGDTGTTARKTYDIEVWLPGENTYREISSCSNCWDYQARRMNTRFRVYDPQAKKPPLHFVHTLNGSGIAIGRALIAIVENYQKEDGSVMIPEVLRPYMGGMECIKLNG